MTESSRVVVLRSRYTLEARSPLNGGNEWMERLLRTPRLSGVKRHSNHLLAEFPELGKGGSVRSAVG